MGTGRLPWACPTAERASSRNEPPNRPGHSIIAIERAPERISFQPLSVLKVGRRACSGTGCSPRRYILCRCSFNSPNPGHPQTAGCRFFNSKVQRQHQRASQRHALGNCAFPRQKKMTRGKQLNSANVLTSKDQHSMRLGPLGRADDNEFVSATDEDPTELANKIDQLA
jgi:hypothetical protein